MTAVITLTVLPISASVNPGWTRNIRLVSPNSLATGTFREAAIRCHQKPFPSTLPNMNPNSRVRHEQQFHVECDHGPIPISGRPIDKYIAFIGCMF